ncbi:MAG: glycosyltransferase [Rickettsiales bacterium]
MKKLFKFVIILYTLAALSPASARYIYVPFDKSMQKLENAPVSYKYKVLKDLYDQHNPDILHSLDEDLIPKTIHQIWLGPYKLPKEFKKYSQLWQELHPDWQYKLWTEKDVKTLNFPDRDLYEKASSYQEKSEILKFTILKQFGGLYADVDYKPVRKFDYLHHTYKFYGGISPPPEKTNDIHISTSIIASEPNNLIMKLALKRIRDVWDDAEKEFHKEKHVDNTDISLLYKKRVEESFNYIVANKIHYVQRAIILPPTYLNIIIRNKLVDPYLEAIGINSRQRFFHIIHRETLASERKDGTRLVSNLSKKTIDENLLLRNFKKAKTLVLDFYHKYSY